MRFRAYSACSEKKKKIRQPINHINRFSNIFYLKQDDQHSRLHPKITGKGDIMSERYYPAQYEKKITVAHIVPQAALTMAGVGAVIGGTAAMAENIRLVKQADIKREDAIKNTIRETVGTGIAAAAATVFVGSLRANGLFSILGFIAVATGAKYVWDGATNKKQGAEETSIENKTESNKEESFI